MPNSLQISALDISSNSRSVKTADCRAGRPSRQLRNASQNSSRSSAASGRPLAILGSTRQLPFESKRLAERSPPESSPAAVSGRLRRRTWSMTFRLQIPSSQAPSEPRPEYWSLAPQAATNVSWTTSSAASESRRRDNA